VLLLESNRSTIGQSNALVDRAKALRAIESAIAE
jgi:hypothetical protein